MIPVLSNRSRIRNQIVLIGFAVAVPAIMLAVLYGFREHSPTGEIWLKRLGDFPTDIIYPNRIVASDDGHQVLVGSNGRDEVIMLSCDTNTISDNLVAQGWVYSSTTFASDNKQIAIAETSDVAQPEGTNRRIRILSSQDFSTTDTISTDDRYVQCLCFSPDSRRIAAADKTGKVSVWDLKTLKETATFDGSDHATSYVGTHAIAYSPDGDLIAVGIENSLLLLDSDSLEVRMHKDHHKYSIQDIAFSNDGSLLATVTGGNSLCLWTISDGSLHASIATANTDSANVAFIQNNVIVIGTAYISEREVEGIVDLWQLPERKRIQLLEPSVRFTKFSMAGTSEVLFGADEDGRVRQWQITLPDED